jgi:hypothetical protein
VPFVNIPHIPHIPTLHEGGVFQSNVPAGEGLALLRDDELVVTPEQRTTADDLLRPSSAGTLPPAPPGRDRRRRRGADQPTTSPSSPVRTARCSPPAISQATVWNLNNGTRRVGEQEP